MKLQIVSDIHLGLAPCSIPNVDADVLVLAGDIHRPTEALRWAKDLNSLWRRFLAPEQPRSHWDHETLTEQPWDVEKVKSLFAAAEARFNAIQR